MKQSVTELRNENYLLKSQAEALKSGGASLELTIKELREELSLITVTNLELNANLVVVTKDRDSNKGTKEHYNAERNALTRISIYLATHPRATL